MMIRIREAVVAGSFYPADLGELETTVRRLLDAVPVASRPARTNPPAKAVIVPHAGISYSGPVAATAYARLLPQRSRYRRVVLLGPAHRVAFRGVAASSAKAFHTPLGEVPLDRAAIDELRHPVLHISDVAHEGEHSLEVELPFLQAVLPPFTLVPLVVGDAAAEDVADVIDLLWGGPETLLVVSSDLSHYLCYDEARSLDRDTCRAIERLDERNIDHRQACGATPLRALLIAARRHGMRAVTLDLRNSGDTAGDRSSVVGYGAWIFEEDDLCERAA
jgi:AmmeMemoRadiSam system protein B